MRRVALLGSVLFAGTVVAPQSEPVISVALYSMAVADTTKPHLRSLSDSCATLMARRLAAESVSVVRRPPPMAQLRRARTAQYAITGTLKSDSGRYDTELKLWDVALNQELRSYYSGPDSLACRVPEAAATRIGTVIRQIERGKRAQSRP